MANSIAPSESTLLEPVLQDLDVFSQSTATETLGKKVKANDGREFQYVRVHSSVNATTGAPVVLVQTTTTGGFCVTPDLSSGGTNPTARFAGVLMGDTTNNVYGWIQIAGICSDALTNTGVTAGNYLYLDSTDKKFNGYTSDLVSTHVVTGSTTAVTGCTPEVAAIALEADDSGETDIRIMNGGI